MGNSLRCCLACVLPCGALDLIRIVHLDGSVDELTGRVTAAQVLNNNPNHVLTKPSSQPGMGRRTLTISPDSELKRGSIYFLIPAAHKTHKNKILKKLSSSKNMSPEINKKSSSRRRRWTKTTTVPGFWKPHLDSISEDY